MDENMNGLSHITDRISSKIRQDPVSNVYIIQSVIGRGKFAVVKKVKHRDTGDEYAAKFIRKRRKGEDCRNIILLELVMLELARLHPRLIDMKEVFETTHDLIVIMELAAGGELHNYCMGLDDTFKEKDVVKLLHQTLEGLQFLHDKNIVHLDLKPQNILLTETYPRGGLKIADFSCAQFIAANKELCAIVGTPDYVAPEVLSYEPISTFTDIWSIGVLAYVMLTGHSPFAGDDKQETFLNISQVNLDFPDELFTDVSNQAQDFITKCLVKEPSERLTAAGCLNHPWLKSDELIVPLPLRSPFGSPIGCRRALTNNNEESITEDVGPAKKYKFRDSLTSFPENINNNVTCASLSEEQLVVC